MFTNHSAASSNMRIDRGSGPAVLCDMYQRYRRDHRMDNTRARKYQLNDDTEWSN